MCPAEIPEPESGWSRRDWLRALLPAPALLAGCGRRESQGAAAAPGSRSVIQNGGSDTMVNIAQAWAEEYARVDPSVSVEVSGGGSGTGIASLINGTIDIANCSRRIEPKERERAQANSGLEPREFILGYDALAIYVHRDNPLEEIDLTQVAEIYREDGHAKTWSDLGVQNTACKRDRIIRVSRQSNSGTYHYFREAVLGKGADFRLGSLDLHGSKDVVELIARTPCAIGYSGIGYANDHVRVLRVAKAPGQTAFAPTIENTQSGSYPIARPLYMYTAGEPKAHIRAFMKWAHGPEGQRIVQESGYVPLLPEQQQEDL